MLKCLLSFELVTPWGPLWIILIHLILFIYLQSVASSNCNVTAFPGHILPDIQIIVWQTTLLFTVTSHLPSSNQDGNFSTELASAVNSIHTCVCLQLIFVHLLKKVCRNLFKKVSFSEFKSSNLIRRIHFVVFQFPSSIEQAGDYSALWNSPQSPYNFRSTIALCVSTVDIALSDLFFTYPCSYMMDQIEPAIE